MRTILTSGATLTALAAGLMTGLGFALPLGGSATAATVQPSEAAYVKADLIPRDVLFGNPARSQVQFSPLGKRIAFMAPLDGVQNVFVAPAGDMDAARPLTNDQGRGILGYFWAPDSEHILYIQDTGGNENFQLFSVNLESGETRNYTEDQETRTQVLAVEDDIPGEILVGLNKRDPRYFDVYRLDLDSGEMSLVYENPQFTDFVFDRQFNLRFGVKPAEDGGSVVMRRTGEDGSESWEPFVTIPVEDSWASRPLGFNKAGGTFYMLDSKGRDTAALYAIDAASGERTLLAEDARADIGGVLTDQESEEPIAYFVNYLKGGFVGLTGDAKGELEYLAQEIPGSLNLASRTADDRTWLIASNQPEAGTVYWRYDRDSSDVTRLFSTRPELADYTLAPMHAREIKTRDGLTMVSYLTLPPGTDEDGDGVPNEPLPMVMDVHGGPWGRDSFGYNTSHQWLANRGYAVLSVNFRSSTGFGKAFVNAGNQEWGRKMNDDLIDGKNWAEENGIAQPGKTALMGGSYGGYATLAGLAFTPEQFSCGVDIVGPSNLETLLSTIPPYWVALAARFKVAMGDLETEEGRAALKRQSPVYKAGQISKPLLIGQGANDPRVNQAESDQIVEAMQENGLPVTYVIYPDEGHGFRRPENRLAFNAIAEAFLSECQGGRFEPMGNALDGSSTQVPVGVEYVPGLADALEGFEPKIAQ